MNLLITVLQKRYNRAIPYTTKGTVVRHYENLEITDVDNAKKIMLDRFDEIYLDTCSKGREMNMGDIIMVVNTDSDSLVEYYVVAECGFEQVSVSYVAKIHEIQNRRETVDFIDTCPIINNDGELLEGQDYTI